MEQEERLFQILKALASSSKKALTIKSLMKQAMYKDHKELNKDLKKLQQLGLIQFRRSGFPSDSNQHKKIVVLNAEPIRVHSDQEFPEEENLSEERETAIRFSAIYTSCYLVEVFSPQGTSSYQTLDDFLKNPLEEISKIKRIVDMRDGAWLNVNDSIRNQILQRRLSLEGSSYSS
jgi:hypothetical protein